MLSVCLPTNLHASLRGLLERLDLAEEQVSRELDAMQPVSFARATNRRAEPDRKDQLRIAILVQVCNHIHTNPRSSAAMSKRINIMIDDDTCGVLGRITAGERSRTINEAIRDWAVRRRRRDAVREMDALRTQLPKVSTDEVARWVRDDRERGH